MTNRSAPYTAIVNSVSGNIPGYNLGHSGKIPMQGPGVPSVSFGPGMSSLPTMGVGKNGGLGRGLPRGEFNSNGLKSNTFDQASYIIHASKGGEENHIIQGMLVYMLTEPSNLKLQSKTLTTYTPISIGQLNMILWQAHNNVLTNAMRGNLEAARVLDLLKRVSESELLNYEKLQRLKEDKDKRIEIENEEKIYADARSKTHEAEVAELHEFSKKVLFFYAKSCVIIKQSRSISRNFLVIINN